MQKKSEKKFRNAMREQEIDSSFYFCFCFFRLMRSCWMGISGPSKSTSNEHESGENSFLATHRSVSSSPSSCLRLISHY